MISVLSTLVLYTINGVTNSLQKKVLKEITKTFDLKNPILEVIVISQEINNQLNKPISDQRLFKIKENNEIKGFAYIDKALSKTDEFDYVILLNKNLIIVKTKVLIYREDYGGEIGSNRWLKQFIGKNKEDKLIYNTNIMAISGATISAQSITKAINVFLQDLNILYTNTVFQ